MSKVSGKLHDEFERTVAASEPEPKVPVSVVNIKTSSAPKNLKSAGGIIVDGEYGCQVKFAKCCNPLPGDSVVGFITKGYGISIHKHDCPNLLTMASNPENTDRLVEAHWEETTGTGQDMYEAQLSVYVFDRLGIVADISVALSEMKVFLLQINTTKSGTDKSVVNLKISCKNVEHYRSIVSRLKAIDGVTDVSRGFS